MDSGIEACTSAADALQQAMQVELHPGEFTLPVKHMRKREIDLLFYSQEFADCIPL